VTIVKVKSPYSYLVDMGNVQVRHIHANKIRKFIARVHGCGVISDRDVEFGHALQLVSVVCDGKPSERVTADKLTHLSDEHSGDLLSVLTSFLFVLVTGQACIQGPFTVSRRRPSSSRNGCGPIACRRCSSRMLKSR